MSDMTILVVLYAVAVLMLIAEIFIPSHGVLSVAGIGFLIAAVAKTFAYGGREAGVIAVLACLVFVPSLAFVAIKYWPRTPIGRRIAPPNPVRTASDTSVPVEELRALVGQRGARALAASAGGDRRVQREANLVCCRTWDDRSKRRDRGNRS